MSNTLTADKIACVQPSEAGARAFELDESSFHAFHQRTAAPLKAYVTRVLGNATQADDIVQESYLRLLRKPPATGDPQQLRAYLFRIASNLITDHWRQRQRERAVPEEAAETKGTSDPDGALRLDMRRVFERLNPRQRQLMWLAYVEGADHTEIAAALGLGAPSVRVLLFRARRKLAHLLRPGTPGET